MKHLSALQNIKCITSVTECSLQSEVATFQNSLVQKKIRSQLKKVEVYTFTYKVKKLEVVGYVVLPKNGDNLPCLIHLRGGSRDKGMITPKGIIGNLLLYAAEGFAVITTQYPGVDGGDGLDEFGGVEDMASIKKLRDILKDLPSVNEKSLGVKGHSRGGLMVYMLLREVSWIKAAMASAAPADMVKMVQNREGWQEHQKRMWGGDKTGAIKRSPIRRIDELPKKVPILIMQGSADWRVEPSHSFAIVESLCKQNHPHRFIFFEGADHGITEYRSEYHRQTIDWFTRWLKNKESLPNMKPHGQ
jgi:dipeptidyl aminopeptidase/acylaminoacyl peptidase